MSADHLACSIGEVVEQKEKASREKELYLKDKARLDLLKRKESERMLAPLAKVAKGLNKTRKKAADNYRKNTAVYGDSLFPTTKKKKKPGSFDFF